MKMYRVEYGLWVLLLGRCLDARQPDTVSPLPIKAPVAADKAHLMALAKDIRVKAFLDLLAYGEGTSYHKDVRISTDQYRITFCNNGKILSFKDHPRERCCNLVGERIICATAAGRYMFLEKTWDWIKERLELRDFSPTNQDIAAIFLLVFSGSHYEITHNNIKGAIAKASRFWAPMPGNSYNQPQTRLVELLREYDKRLMFYESFNLSYPQKGRLCLKK